jgi:hypothetical protein
VYGQRALEPLVLALAPRSRRHDFYDDEIQAWFLCLAYRCPCIYDPTSAIPIFILLQN